MSFLCEARTSLLVCAIVVTLAQSPPPVDAYRVLAIGTIPGKSHWNFMSAVLRALTDGGGHNVTVFTPFPDGDRDNYTEVDLSRDMRLHVGMDAVESLNVLGQRAGALSAIVKLSRESCAVAYGHRRMAEILDGVGPAYDAVFTEIFGSQCASYVAARLGLPLVYLVPTTLMSYVERAVLGDMPNPATASHVLTHHARPVTFVQRFSNLVLSVYTSLALARIEGAMKDAAPQPHDRTEPVKPAVVFLNTHYITDAPRPLLPNVVPVAGLHLRPPQSVPDDLLEFIEGSPHGVIYFTFGSVISMSTLPEHVQNAFREAFSRVPQRVLWKYEGEMLDKPKNVMTSKWFPQRDVLMHPKVKLFVSHGGISGVYESVDAGVPVLGFPLFYDQPRNVDRLVEAGMAISMDLMTVREDVLLANVLELVNNKTYEENAKIASKIFKDRPMSPERSVVYWTEYVIRHKGAPHLKSLALDLTWYQYLLLDVIAVLLVLISLSVFIVYKCSKISFKYVFKNRQQIKVKPE